MLAIFICPLTETAIAIFMTETAIAIFIANVRLSLMFTQNRHRFLKQHSGAELLHKEVPHSCFRQVKDCVQG